MEQEARLEQTSEMPSVFGQGRPEVVSVVEVSLVASRA